MSAPQEASAANNSGTDPQSGGSGPPASTTRRAWTLRARLALLMATPLLVGLLAFGATYLVRPTFTARTSFMPPQQAQSGTASALASLGALSSLTGGGPAMRSPAEQYVSLMQSVTLSDRLIDKYMLMKVYNSRYRDDTRKELAQNVRIAVGRKDGLITLEVDDHSPQRAADIANRYVDELRQITGTLAVTEAQQRRVFFETELQHSRDRLASAQTALQASGFNAGALKAEPKAAAEAYARLRAEATTAEVRLQALRGSLADSTPEVRQQLAMLDALREQLARIALPTDASVGPDYIGKFRDFKYQETLFELYARQYEQARADESREGALIQVVDPATPAERKSSPKRALIALSSTLVAFLGLAALMMLPLGPGRPAYMRRAAADPQ